MPHLVNKDLCCGCTACASACPKQCITMIEDKEGFLYPIIDIDSCVECGACEKACPVINRMPDIPFKQYAFLVQHRDEQILRESTSGGAFTTLAANVINKKGIVFGAAYNEKYDVVHIGIENIADLKKFRNSKYVQSNVTGVFAQVKYYLNSGRYVLFSGTPCELEGLLNYLKKNYDNLLTVDIMCHACPSPLVFRKYLDVHQRKNNGKIQDVRFREKKYGYKYSTMSIIGDHFNYDEGIDTDVMLRAFFSNISPRPSCFNCAFKKRYRRTDITLWDCFNVYKFSKRLDNDKGVTRVLVHTSKGLEAVNSIEKDAIVEEIDADAAVYGVKEMTQSVKMNPRRTAFFEDLNSMDAEECFNKYFPVTFHNILEKQFRLLANRLGIYPVLKRTIKTILSGKEMLCHQAHFKQNNN